MSSWRLVAARAVVLSMFAGATAPVARADVIAFSPDGLWSILDRMPNEVALGQPWVRPDRFSPVQLDGDRLTGMLLLAPLEDTPAAAQPLVLTLPTPDGGFASFRVVESPIMERELQARFPQIRTYLGQGVDDRAATVRFDWTPQGFHAQVLSPDGSWYIDPFSRDNTTHYASYYKRDLAPPAGLWHCDTEGEFHIPDVVDAPLGDQRRTYRLAVAATGEYTTFHGGTVNAGMSAITTAVNRVTGIYEKEVSVRFTLIANNDAIVYTNSATDPYTNNNGSAMLSQNQSTLNSVIGSANYDMGHVFSTGGGGIAGLGVVCTSTKAHGVTGLPAPIGDPFYVDYVCHEMGHQFGANHTFNGPGCGGGRAASSAYEPGSASTIMGYAGICGADNIQNSSDAYFHSRSFDEIRAFIVSGNGNACDALAATGNNYPTISAGPVYTIPRSTPFALTASGSDPDGDPLTYTWEQYNLGPALSLASGDNGSSPIIRSFTGTTNPTRTIPRLANLLNGSNAPGEILPTTNRTLVFRVTARDNKAGGGGVDWASTSVTVTTSAGPFLVTSPNSFVTWFGTRTVTWDVANTNGATVNTQTVDILLSTDGGNTFPITLLAGTPNDGSAEVTLPSINTTTARIKVAAVNNIYFDISNMNFTITPVPGPPNDACADALHLSDGATPFSTVGATTDGPAEPDCAFGGDNQIGNDLWYNYTASCNGLATISLCGANYNSRMAVYTGILCPVQSGFVFECNDDFCAAAGASEVTFEALAGAVYKIRIGGAQGATGSGTITASCGAPPAPCYANCDGSTSAPVLNVGDFTCFLQRFAAGEAYANCDGSTSPPTLNVGDFTCFLQKFAAGCP